MARRKSLGQKDTKLIRKISGADAYKGEKYGYIAPQQDVVSSVELTSPSKQVLFEFQGLYAGKVAFRYFKIHGNFPRRIGQNVLDKVYRLIA